jgi:hypothetical protein
MLHPDETLTVYGPRRLRASLSGVARMSTREETALPERVLVDGLGYELTPKSVEDLVRGLAEIDAAARERVEPVLATLYANATDDAPPSLGIGLGAEDSVLVYDAGNWSGEGGFSKGSRTGDVAEVGFRYGTAVNEYLGWMLIPKEAAFAAAQEFFRTGQRPTTVEWGTA